MKTNATKVKQPSVLDIILFVSALKANTPKNQNEKINWFGESNNKEN